MAGLDPVGSGKQEENPKSSWVGISQSKFGGETSQLSSLFFSFFEKALFLPVIGTVFRKFSVHLDCARVVIQRTPGGGGLAGSCWPEDKCWLHSALRNPPISVPNSSQQETIPLFEPRRVVLGMEAVQGGWQRPQNFVRPAAGRPSIRKHFFPRHSGIALWLACLSPA